LQNEKILFAGLSSDERAVAMSLLRMTIANANCEQKPDHLVQNFPFFVVSSLSLLLLLLSIFFFFFF
jgi:hypothetical protein